MKVKSQRRRYNEFCALARALDEVGERWTLLVVRELIFGPRRYTDLLRNLPGIGTNLLAKRLRELEHQGILQHTKLPPPSGAIAYELTDRGRRLETVLVALARWGMEPIEPPRKREESRPGWYMLAMRAAFRADLAGGVRETYELQIDGEVFHLRVDHGEVLARQGSAEAPALTVESDTRTLLALLTGALEPSEAQEQAGCRLVGDPDVLGRWLQLFRLPRPGTSLSATR